MKLTFKPINDGPLTFQLEAQDDVGLFEQIAHIQSLFGDTCCGKCKGTHLEFRVRKAKTKTGECNYYERVCMDCGAKLDFGQSRENRGLYPKRTLNDNGRNVYDKENNGWHVWEPPAPPKPLPPAQKTVMRPAPAPVQDDDEDVPF